MNGFGGEIGRQILRLLDDLGATRPVRSESTIADLALAPEDVKFAVNAEFFRSGGGLPDTAVSPDTTVNELILEIMMRLRQKR
jgi:hypothetical protein